MTSLGASYMPLTMAARAMTASSPSDSVYHSRSRSSGVRAGESPSVAVAGALDVEACAELDDADEEDGDEVEVAEEDEGEA